MEVDPNADSDLVEASGTVTTLYSCTEPTTGDDKLSFSLSQFGLVSGHQWSIGISLGRFGFGRKRIYSNFKKYLLNDH